MAGQDFAIPRSGLQMQTLLRSILIISGSGLGSLASVVVLSRYFGTIPILNRLALQPPAPEEHSVPEAAGEQPVPSLGGVRLGDHGIADSPLRPAGRVLFGDDYADVVTDGSFVEKGRAVRVINISGNRIVVRVRDEVG